MKKIIVLLGGYSSEREVSLVSGRAVGGALRQLGYEVVYLDPADGRIQWNENDSPVVHEMPPPCKNPDPEELKKRRQQFHHLIGILIEEQPDFVFNALHGGEGEDGHWQALLDMLGIPYNGSDAIASAMAMHKSVAKKLFDAAGVLTPRSLMFPENTPIDKTEPQISAHLRYPVVVKPDCEGSTVGLSIVADKSGLSRAFSLSESYGAVLVEEYIEGREITVAILGDQALPVIEIIPEGGFYDYVHKYQKGKTQYVCPADLLKSSAEKVQHLALKAFQSLGCSGYARVDFRLGLDSRFYCLEVNTLPGMTETSLVPKAAKAAGIEFPELIDTIIRLSLHSR